MDPDPLEKKTREAQEDSRTTPDLIEATLAARRRDDEDAAWDMVVLLQFRATREVLEQSQRLTAAIEPERRVLGADILGQLGVPTRAFPAECLATLTDLLGSESDPSVLTAGATALGHLGDSRSIPVLVELASHTWPIVRHAVAQALGSHEAAPAVTQALIALSQDPSPDVRDWATFGLGSQSDEDSPAIRQALLERVEDPDDHTRAEALVGLARRGDERAVEPLLAALTADVVGSLVVEAAESVASPRLLPALRKLATWWDVDPDLLERAIKACIPEP